MSDLLARIHRRRDALGLSSEGASLRCGLPRGAIRGIENGFARSPHYEPNLTTMKKLAIGLGTTLEWLASGTGPETTDKVEAPVSETANPEETDRRYLPEHGGVYNLRPDGVPEVATRGSLGPGGVEAFLPVTTENGITIAQDLVADEWGIPDAFVRVLRTRRSALRIMEVEGDSGYDPARPDLPGSLLPGDKVFIDTADRRPSPPGPFAVWDGIGVVVKWIEVDDSSGDPMVVLRSRNPTYSERRRHLEEVRILGRVRGRITLF